MIVSPLASTLTRDPIVSSTGAPAFTITSTARGGFSTRASSSNVAAGVKSPSFEYDAMNSSVRRWVRL